MNLYFPKRVPEPKKMGKIEQKAFEHLSKNNYRRWFMPLTDHALRIAKLKKGEVIDVACGPGFLTKEIAKRSKKIKVFGIDCSTSAIALAKNNCKKMKNVFLKKGDIDRLDFPNEKFNLVICKDSLHHFNNPAIAIKEMARITKPKGVIYIQDLRRDLPKYLLKRSVPPNSIIKQLQYYSVRASYTKAEVKKILQALKIGRIKILTRKTTPSLVKYYKQKGIDPNGLKESFQSRYVAIIKK